MNKREIILESYPDLEIMTADGFDDAIIGYCERSDKVIYSIKECINILINQDMSEEEAFEYFYYNVEGAYMGDKTPIWCNDLVFNQIFSENSSEAEKY
jgi:hypothetical protein